MERHFSEGSSEFTGVHWNRPEGGFFMTVNMPFEFTMSLVEECAATAGVIVAPMSLFAFATAHCSAIRLSFSAVASHDIDEGVARLAHFVQERQSKIGGRRGEPVQSGFRPPEDRGSRRTRLLAARRAACRI
jgi:(S)-3,5-dihydroxyphenylglycine transaminase